MTMSQSEPRQQRLARIVQQWENDGRVDDADVQWLIISAVGRQLSAEPQQPQPEQPV